MNARTKPSSLLALACLCLGLFLAGCKSETVDGTLDTSKLPRVAGAKAITASPTVTVFTSPNSVAQTGDVLEKSLAEAGWQKYTAPNAAAANDPAHRMLSMKKGKFAISVFVSVAPAQNNATSVQYSVLPLKTDLPFANDASNIEYSPDKPLLMLITAQPVNDTLDFYRKQLAARGWSLWSNKTGAKQAAGGSSGVVHKHGAYAEYVNDKEPAVVLVLTALKADAGKIRIELKEWPIATLKTGRATSPASQFDVSKLPRLEGAELDPAHASKSDTRFHAPVPVNEASAAVVKLLSGAGWQQYLSPSEKPSATLMFFKKGPQGLTVSLTQRLGQPTQASVNYSPAWIYVDLPLTDDASYIVFDERRPYLNYVTAEKADALPDFYRNELGAAGWVPLTASEAAARWPDAKLEGKIYYTREKQKPILLSFTPQDGGKTRVEIKVAPFAQPQVLEAGDDIFGLPRPKQTKNAGATDGRPDKELHAAVIAEVAPVLAFYRRELGKRNWKEESEGAVVKPEEVKLNFTSPEGPAVLTIGHKYDLTNVHLVQTIAKPVVNAAPSVTTPGKDNSLDDMMKQVQQMVHDAGADAMSAAKKAPQANGPAEILQPLAGNTAPIPVPGTASDPEFDSAEGKLEFNSSSSVKSVADFYRSAMRQQGWSSRPSVINNANMVVLEFSKGGKSLGLTIMRMGNRTNVSAEGPALLSAATKPAPSALPGKKDSAADSPSQAASADDLIVEESGGLPMPKRHTLSVGDKSPFRRELNANVPLDFAAVLAFYRRELSKRAWKEESGAVIAADHAVIAFTSAEGPGLLKLGRKDGETTVNLTTRNPEAAAKAGVAPKAGQAKLLISNPNEAEAVLVINKQTIKAPAGSGIKGPDGATVDLPPGKYKFTIKMPGKPVSQDEISVAADETWGLLIGPGGALPVHVY